MASNKIPMKPLRSSVSEDKDPKVMWTKLKSQMVQCIGSGSSVDELDSLIGKGMLIEEYFDLQFRDEFGYTMLGIAVRRGLVSFVQFLVEKHNFKVKEEVIIAVEMNDKELVGYLLSRKPDLVNRRTLAGTTFKPGSSPVMAASLAENESMLRFLFSRGATPLSIPDFNSRDVNNIIRFDAVFRTIKALSKPVYLCIMNEDPLMVAFKISETCEQLASVLDAAKNELLQIKQECDHFTTKFIENVSNFAELEAVLNLMTTEDETLVAPGENWERLKYAMTHNHVDFVANGGIQKLIKRKWYEGPMVPKDFESRPLIQRALYVVAMMALAPVWIILFLIFPASDTPTGKLITGWLETPFMRFLVQLALYVFLVGLIMVSTARGSAYPSDELDIVASHRNCYAYVLNENYTCLEADLLLSDNQKAAFRNDSSEFQKYVIEEVMTLYRETHTNTSIRSFSDGYLLLWTVGNIVREQRLIWSLGLVGYVQDWVNGLAMIRNYCLLSSFSMKFVFILKEGYHQPGLNADDYFHPMTMYNTLMSIGLLALLLHVYKLLRVTEAIGRPQYLLGATFSASFFFFVIFASTFLGTSVGINGMIWSTYYQYMKACYFLENPSNETNVSSIPELNIPCPNRNRGANLEEMQYMMNFFNVLTELFFAMFNSETQIQKNFPTYINAPEWVMAMLYSIYTTAMIIVRFNILISLIIFAVLDACKVDDKIFKFRRTQFYYAFIVGQDPVPSPFNIFPSLYRITKYLKARQNRSVHNLFTEEELKQVPRLREIILKLKLTYLRNQKTSKGKKNLTTTDAKDMHDKIDNAAIELLQRVAMVQTRTQQLNANKISTPAVAKNDVHEQIKKNKFMQNYKSLPGDELLGRGKSAISSLFQSKKN